MDRPFINNVVTAILLFVFAKFIGCTNDVGSPILIQVQYINRTSSGAHIAWSGVDLENVKSCQVTYGIKEVNSTDSPKYTIVPVVPLNTHIVLSNLLANAYSLFVECTDKNDVAHHSTELLIPAATIETTTSDVSHLPKHPHPYSNGALHPSDSSPSVVPEKSGGPSDIMLGVLVGMLGVSIIVGVTYHVAKRYRRNLRIRRLLQYRQHDSDPFADMDPDSEQ